MQKIPHSALFLIFHKKVLTIFWFWRKNFWILNFWSGHPDLCRNRYFRVFMNNFFWPLKSTYDPGSNHTMPEDEHLPQRTFDLCKNRYFCGFMGNVPLTWHKQAHKETHWQNLFYASLNKCRKNLSTNRLSRKQTIYFYPWISKRK